MPAITECFSGTKIQTAAQNIHEKESGAYTGEVSGSMLSQLGASHVIIAHSERRQYFGETILKSSKS